MAYTWPVPLNAPITQYFAANPYSPVQPAGHTGMDFAVPMNTSIKSIGAGTVIWADWATKLSPSNPWYIAPAFAGIVVLISHGNIISVYAHLNSTHLNIGDKVAQGQEVAKSGNSGLSTGPHLHFEIFPNPITGPVNWLANRVNPLNYITKTSPAPAPIPGPVLKPNQRRVGASNVNLRSAPNTDPATKIVRIIEANTTETFTGYVTGERVNGKNLWYRDAEGFAHCDGFTTQVTTGLPNLTPKPVPPTYRSTGSAIGKVRAYPRIGAAELGETKPSMTYDIQNWTTGDEWEGSNVWFQVRGSTGWIHSMLFTSQSTASLTKVVVPEPTWRKTGASGGAYRDVPDLEESSVLGALKPNTNYVMKAWTEGDEWQGSNVWFQGTGDWWAHSMLFTSQDTSSLTKVANPTPEPVPPVVPKPEPEQPPTKIVKVAASVGVNLRTLPTITSSVIGAIPGGNDIPITGYVEHPTESIDGSKIWFVVEPGGYVHTTGVTDASITGLTKKPMPTLPVADNGYSFVKDFDFVEYIPANTWNMQNGNFPARPEKVVLHQFDAKEKKPSIAGVISHFQTDRRPAGQSSAHFVVSGKRIVQMVSLKDRAYHAGPTNPKGIVDAAGNLISGNDYIGIEIDPQEDADTIASVKKLLTAIKAKYGYLPEYTEHQHVPNTATSCGTDIHLENYTLEEATKPEPEVVVPPPVVDEPDVPTKEQIEFVLNYLLSQNTK